MLLGSISERLVCLQNTSFVETVHPEDVEKCMVATHELDMLIREIIDQAGQTLESLMLSNNLND